MNKLAILTIIIAVTALTACSKPTTEIKPGERKISESSSASAPQPASHALALASPATVSNDPYAILKTDIAKIQEFGMSQEKKAAALEQKIRVGVEKQDKAALKKLQPEFKAFVTQSNNDFNALDLRSTEAKNLRSKMTASSALNIEMNEEMFADKPNQKNMEALQQKIIHTQQELMAISQDIRNKIAPPQEPASAAKPAEKHTK